jgi:SAM-dependent methyltransferase
MYYGYGPGPIARRAVRYHRPLRPRGGTALDAGRGEGQDLAFLNEQGYEATGVEWTDQGLAKTGRLLGANAGEVRLIQADLRSWNTTERFDLVLAVNSVQFLGADAPDVLQKVARAVAPGGVLGLSVFAREDASQPALDGSIYRWTIDEILDIFRDWHPFEAALLWQWGAVGRQPFVTLVAGNLGDHDAGPVK